MEAVELADGGVLLFHKSKGVPTIVFREGDTRREVELDGVAFEQTLDAVRTMPTTPRSAIASSATLVFTGMPDYPGEPRLLLMVKAPPVEGRVQKRDDDIVLTIKGAEREAMAMHLGALA